MWNLWDFIYSAQSNKKIILAFEYVFGLKNTFYQGIESSNRILLLLSNNSSYLAPESVRRIGMYLLAYSIFVRISQTNFILDRSLKHTLKYNSPLYRTPQQERKNNYKWRVGPGRTELMVASTFIRR